jgi:hypothetical protein
MLTIVIYSIIVLQSFVDRMEMAFLLMWDTLAETDKRKYPKFPF